MLVLCMAWQVYTFGWILVELSLASQKSTKVSSPLYEFLIYTCGPSVTMEIEFHCLLIFVTVYFLCPSSKIRWLLFILDALHLPSVTIFLSLFTSVDHFWHLRLTDPTASVWLKYQFSFCFVFFLAICSYIAHLAASPQDSLPWQTHLWASGGQTIFILSENTKWPPECV